jgi:hypothetical protein
MPSTWATWWDMALLRDSFSGVVEGVSLSCSLLSPRAVGQDSRRHDEGRGEKCWTLQRGHAWFWHGNPVPLEPAASASWPARGAISADARIMLHGTTYIVCCVQFPPWDTVLRGEKGAVREMRCGAGRDRGSRRLQEEQEQTACRSTVYVQ